MLQYRGDFVLSRDVALQGRFSITWREMLHYRGDLVLNGEMLH